MASDWAASPHQVGGDWKSGNGLIGYERNAVVPPGLNTEIADPSQNDIITYYFETDFDVTAAQLAASSSIQLQHVIDDGAVFYLNGVELLRFNMNEGVFDASTTASSSVNNAVLSDPLLIPADRLNAGTNRLSVELHQRTASSNDVVFGVEIALARQLDEGVPPTPYAENDEEWIELYNRSEQAVDLSGWSVDDAVQYAFPAGTVMDPGGTWCWRETAPP